MKTKRKKKSRPFNSTLPVWIVEPGEMKGTIIAECPQCGGRAILILKRWKHTGDNKGFVGRSCPYCFRTNRQPVKYMSKELLDLLERDPDEVENKNGMVLK